MIDKSDGRSEGADVDSLLAVASLRHSNKQKKFYRSLYFVLSGLFLIQYLMIALRVPEGIVNLIAVYVTPVVISVGLFYFIFRDWNKGKIVIE